MDFGGALGVDALVPECRSLFYSPLSPGDAQGSGKGGAFANVSYKHDRPAEAAEYDWRSVKMARSDALTNSAARATPLDLRSNSQPLFPDGEKMLSFSTASQQQQQGVDAAGDGNLTYGGACHSSAPTSSTQCYLRNAGLYSGNSNSNMQGVLARVRGPFTPSQWLELEHQALIYKYLVANVPVPPTLLIPIRKSLSASGFPTLSAGSFGSVGWGSFQLYAGIADPEPGRCRRTDGKKWRCSRDAVADQKYCERHMNRGRHRSRKHVEGHAGHASKAMPAIASSQSASAVPDGASSGSLTMSQLKSKSLQSNITNPSLGQFNGLSMSMEDQNGTSKILSMPNPASQKPTNALYPVAKQHNPFEETSSGTNIGLISSDSLLNISSSSLSNSISLIPNPKLTDQQIQSHPLRQFIDVCRKTNSDHSAVTWPEIEESNSDRTQLSISIPMACSDFSSSSSSNHDKLALSPLRLSREHDPIPMGLGVGLLNEVCHHHANWRPISWEASLAGPLGEVLNSTNSTTPRDQSRNFLSSASQNIPSDGWDSGHQMESSPTGVLQKNSFSSLSSSTGSSPRAERLKMHENNGSLCNNLLGSAIEVQQMR